MSILEILAWILPIASFGILGFAEEGGGNGNGEGDKGGKGDKEGDGNGEEGDKEIDPTIKELLNNPDGIKSLLDSKRKANAEAKERRLELEKLKKTQQDAETQKLKDQEKYKDLSEKLQAEKDESGSKFKKRVINMALQIEATKQGIVDPDLVKLIDISDVKVNEDYEVENAEDVVKEFKEKKPNFFKKENGDDDGDNDKDLVKGPEDQRPNLHDKVKGTQDGISPDERIRRAYEKKKKK